MAIARRVLLAALPAGVLSAAVLPAGGAGAAPRSAAAAGDPAVVLANTVASCAGTPEVNGRPEAAPKLAAIAATARSRLAAMDAAGGNEVFAGLPLGTSDTDLTTTYQYLYEIALATVTPGDATAGLRDPAVQARVVDALVRLFDDYYGDESQGYYGNWYNWEIGISTHVSRTLVLLRDVIAAGRPDLPAAYVSAMDAYLRNGKDGDVDLDSRFHTGANLADITTNRILQGAVLGDGARITKAVSDQLTVLDTIDPYQLRHGVTDGFYADGSYLQHASVAYTGSYGRDLLTRIVGTVSVLDGSGYASTGPIVDAARDWLSRSFAPVIFEGWMMEIVKGRGVSRTTTGYADTIAVAEAVVDLAQYTADADSVPLKAYVRHLNAAAPPGIAPSAFTSPLSAVRLADILADPSLPTADLAPAASHAAFDSMDRTVHRRPGYAFALARSSDRVSVYEYMSGENLMPWFQGDGAHYLYLSGQDQTRVYGVDHYTAVEPHRLPGVTAPADERRTVPELYGEPFFDDPADGFTSSSDAQNAYVYFPLGTTAYSGGASLGAYGVVGWVQGDDAAWAAKSAGLLPDSFVAYRGAVATKSWFMFDDEIVVLVAGAGDAVGRAATTTVDARIADPSATVRTTGRLRDGRPWSGTGTAPLTWLRCADEQQSTAVGYVFLDGPAPTVALGTVTRSRRLVRSANPDTPVTKQVFSVGYEQPAGASSLSAAYALVPGASERGLAALAAQPPAVLANTAGLQAVRHRALGLLGVNSFTPGRHRVAGLTVDGPASVLMRVTRNGGVTLGLCDPTTRRDTVAVTLPGRRLRAEAPAPGVTVTRVPGGTRVEARTHRTSGRTVTVALR